MSTRATLRVKHLANALREEVKWEARRDLKMTQTDDRGGGGYRGMAAAGSDSGQYGVGALCGWRGGISDERRRRVAVTQEIINKFPRSSLGMSFGEAKDRKEAKKRDLKA
ncbi:hypothetical protein BDZ89DRAFT_1048921 [Hymenopellis radicata]|nr:hypothetical protein BDZ89DRAFT_1048921 [Hymenopellis radicata]